MTQKELLGDNSCRDDKRKPHPWVTPFLCFFYVPDRKRISPSTMKLMCH